MDSRRCIGLDVGGTKVLAALVGLGEDGVPTVLKSAQSPVAGSVSSLLSQLIGAAGSMTETPGVSVRESAIPVGIGIPGYIDRAGMARHAPNLPYVTDVDLLTPLRSALGPLVVVNNDANSAAAAVASAEAPTDENVIVVTLGTGIGGGLVLGGRLYTGHNGFAGEVGHMIVAAGGPLCVCGQRGCWETMASGSALGRLADDFAAGHPSGSLARRRREDRGHLGPDTSLTSPEVVAAVRDGDSEAAAVLDTWIGWVSTGLVSLVNLLDPSRIFLGGGIVAEGKVIMSAIAERVARDETLWDKRSIEVGPTRLGPDAGAIGAAILADRHRSER